MVKTKIASKFYAWIGVDEINGCTNMMYRWRYVEKAKAGQVPKKLHKLFYCLLWPLKCQVEPFVLIYSYTIFIEKMDAGPSWKHWQTTCMFEPCQEHIPH